MLSPNRKSRAALALSAALVLAVSACRRAPAAGPAPAADVPKVALTAVADPAAVAPGATFTVAWRLAATPGWHFYWEGRNDSGFAPRQKLFLPEGWAAGPLQWPAPERLVSPGDILDHVYHDEVVLLQQVTVPRDAPHGAVALRADWQWLTCRDVCVPGRDSLAVAVAVDAQATGSTPSPPPALAAARARLPQPLPAGLVTTAWDGRALRIARAKAIAGGRLTFMPALDCAELADLLNDGEGESLVLHLAPAAGSLARVRGLLLLQDPGAAPRAFTIDISPAATDPKTTGG